MDSLGYELAKQLKDTGFPFERGETEDQRKSDRLRFYDSEGKQFFLPTLSELIEACGERFSEIEKDYWEDGVGIVKGWRCWATQVEEGVMPLTGTGQTPEEAVAKLWLELNKKNHGKTN